MRPIECPTCVAACERTAALTVALRKATATLHAIRGHKAHAWLDCDQDPCRTHATLLGRRPTERPTT